MNPTQPKGVPRSASEIGLLVLMFVAALFAGAVGVQFLLEPYTGWLLPFGVEASTSKRNVRVVGPGDKTPYGVISRFLHQGLSELSQQADANFGVLPLYPTEGSVATVVKVDRMTGADEGFGVGLAQADVLYHYVFGDHPQLSKSRSISNVRSLARMFEEWVLVGRPGTNSNPGHSGDAISRQGRICAQRVGSGSLVTSLNLARVLQAAWSNTLHDCSSACLDGFAQRGVPAPDPTDSTLCLKVLAPGVGRNPGSRRASGWTVLGIPEHVAAAIANLHDESYVALKPETFQHAFPEFAGGSDSTTISVDTVLITGRDTTTEIALATECLIKHWDMQVCGKGVELGPSCEAFQLREIAIHQKSELRGAGFCNRVDALPVAERSIPQRRQDVRFSNLPITRHGAAIIRDLGPFSRFLVNLKLRHLQGLTLLFLSVLVASYASFKRTLRIGRWVQHMPETARRWGIRFCVFVVGHVLVAIAIWLSEYHSEALLANDAFVKGGVPAALRWVVRYVVMNDSSISFQSTWALMFVAALKAGWALLAMALGVDFAKRVEHYWKLTRMKNQVIVIGWHKSAGDLLSEILTASDCVVVPFRETAIPSHAGRRILKWLPPVPTLTEEVLRDAQLADARAVVIVADHDLAKQNEADVDVQTCRLIELYRRQEALITDQPKRLVAEIMNPENVLMATRLGARESPERRNGDETFDTLCTLQYSAQFMGQMALKPALGAFIRELATTRKESNELYSLRVLELSEHVNVRTFGEVRTLFATTNAGKSVVPVGVQTTTITRNNGVLLNPSPDTCLSPEDRILFIGRDSNDMIATARSFAQAQGEEARVIPAPPAIGSTGPSRFDH